MDGLRDLPQPVRVKQPGQGLPQVFPVKSDFFLCSGEEYDKPGFDQSLEIQGDLILIFYIFFEHRNIFPELSCADSPSFSAGYDNLIDARDEIQDFFSFFFHDPGDFPFRILFPQS
ncbi:hypothetical protein ES703_124695 [subsurface metagenome]